MDDVMMIGYIVVGVGTLISVLTPLFKINSNITKMRDSIDHMLENDRIRDERIGTHGKELDAVVRKVDQHEVRITNLERRIEG